VISHYDNIVKVALNSNGISLQDQTSESWVQGFIDSIVTALPNLFDLMIPLVVEWTQEKQASGKKFYESLLNIDLKDQDEIIN